MIKQFYLTLISTATPGQGESESNGNEVIHILQSSKTAASPKDAV